MRVSRISLSSRLAKYVLAILGALMCLGTLAVSTAQAAIIVQDDFTGTSGSPPDTSKWSSSIATDYPAIAGFSVPTLDGSGHVALDSTTPSNTPDIVVAKPSFMAAPTPTAPLQLTVTLSNIVSTHQSLGFSNFSNDGIQIRNDSVNLTTLPAAGGGTLGSTLGASGDWIVLMQTSAGYQEKLTTVTAAAGAAGTWVIDWSPAAVTILFNNAVVFDTGAGGPTLGGASWSIPTAALAPAVYTYFDGQSLLDAMTFETVPEPASGFLALSLSACAMMRRRGSKGQRQA